MLKGRPPFGHGHPVDSGHRAAITVHQVQHRPIVPRPKCQSALRRRRTNHYKPVRNLLQVLHGSIPANSKAATCQVKSQQLVVLKDTVGKLLVQGAWSKVNTTLATDNQWRSMMWSLTPSTQQFATKAALDVLPTRANLLR